MMPRSNLKQRFGSLRRQTAIQLPLASRGNCAIALMMENDEPQGFTGWLRSKQHIIIGVAGLFAWLAMLWFMFGDVL